MSLIRTTADSPIEIPDPKRRSFDKDHSPIDIHALFSEFSIKRLAEILVKSPEVVEKAKAAKQIFLEDGNANTDEGVEKFSKVVREFWPSECFINGLRTLMEDYYIEIVSLVVHYANEDCDHQRWKQMKEDPLFKPSLKSLDFPAATNSDIVRLFLSILFGHWCDKAALANLDDGMETTIFGRKYTSLGSLREKRAREKGKQVLKVKKRDIKNFIYLIKDADDYEETLKFVQEWLVSTYGNDKNVKTDALFKEIQSQLSGRLEISPFYDGKKAKILVHVVDGLYAFVKMDPMCKM